MPGTLTYTHPCPPLILRVLKHIYRGAPLIALSGALLLHTHTSSCLLEIWSMMTHTSILMPTFDCMHKHVFLLHADRSVSLARMWRYTQLSYLFHQCTTRLLSRDDRIADCTVKHPSVEHPFSSSYLNLILIYAM